MVMGSQASILRFFSAGVVYSIPVDQVTRIIHFVALQESPVDKCYIVGILNYHGVAIPVIDISMFIGRKHTESYSKDHSIIICSCGTGFGMVCSEVVDIADTNLDDPAPVSQEAAMSPIKYHLADDKISHPVDLDRVISALSSISNTEYAPSCW